MELHGESLSHLVRSLRARVEMDFKRDVQHAARTFGLSNELSWFPELPPVKNGDDAAAIRQADGSYLLLASDAMRAEFVRQDAWFAGYSAVMVNLSDIAAMGGRPMALVDVLSVGDSAAERVLAGMQEACKAFGVPIVGGHTCRSTAPTTVSCAVLGRAHRLLPSDGARAGDEILFAVDLRGAFRTPIAFNAATTKSSDQLRAQLSLLPRLAESELAHAAKDVSNAGLVGTLAMLLESSGLGAELDLARVPAPRGVDPLRWLMAFPSFGFVLAVDPASADAVCAQFDDLGVACASVGRCTAEARFDLRFEASSERFSDPSIPFTGFGLSAAAPIRPASVEPARTERASIESTRTEPSRRDLDSPERREHHAPSTTAPLPR